MFNPKPWRTCVFEGIGSKRQEYLNRLTQQMLNENFKSLNKYSPIWLEVLGLAGSDLLFQSPDRILVLGIRAVCVKQDLRVGFLRVGKVKPVLLSFFIGLALALVFGIISLSVFESIPLHTRGLIFIAVFMTLLILPVIYLLLLRIKCYRKIRTSLVKTANYVGGKQVTPFRHTTVNLED